MSDVTPVSIYKALNRVYAIFRAVQMLSEDGYTPFGALNVSHNAFWKVAVKQNIPLYFAVAG